MFKPGDEVISKLTNDRAVVMRVDSGELMTVKFRTRKFRKGNLEAWGETVLIKNFKPYSVQNQARA
jgi:hypothetical protein